MPAKKQPRSVATKTTSAPLPDTQQVLSKLLTQELGSEHTRRNFASDLKRFREAFGRRRVDRLKADDLRAYLEGLTTSRGGPERPVSAQTFNRHFGTLCNFLGWLERLEEIDRNPMDKV